MDASDLQVGGRVPLLSVVAALLVGVCHYEVGSALRADVAFSMLCGSAGPQSRH